MTIILNILFGRSLSPKTPVSGGAIESVIQSTRENLIIIRRQNALRVISMIIRLHEKVSNWTIG